MMHGLSVHTFQRAHRLRSRNRLSSGYLAACSKPEGGGREVSAVHNRALGERA